MPRQLPLLDSGMSFNVTSREVRALSKLEISALKAFTKLHLSIRESKTNKPVVVAMIGLVGSGKSSVAQHLSEEIGATVIDYEKIRLELRSRRAGYEAEGAIARILTLNLLRQGNSIILDTDFVDARHRRALRERMRHADAPLVFIRTHADFKTTFNRLLGADHRRTEGFVDPILSEMMENDDIASVKIGEMFRQLLQHYRATDEGQKSRLVTKKFSRILSVQNDIDTTNYNDWKKAVKVCATKLLE